MGLLREPGVPACRDTSVGGMIRQLVEPQETGH